MSTTLTSIKRLDTGPRMSQAVRHENTIYLAGQVGTPGDSVTGQTRSCLEKVDALLARMGTDKTGILQATIWLADMADFPEMNAVWDDWVPQGHTPARATGEAKLATPAHAVEVIVIAAANPREQGAR